MQQGGRQQRAGNFSDAVWRFCFANECTCFREPIKGQSKTTKTYFCPFINKNCTYLWKILDWSWARNLFVHRLPSVKTTGYSSSWSSTSRRRWSEWILETERLFSEPIWALSTLVWWNVEEHGGGNKNIFQYCTDPSGLFFSTKNPSSWRLFRTQSHWSFITGQWQFIRVHLSHRVCNQLKFHHEVRIDTGRTKFKQKTDGILYVCESYEQRTQRSETKFIHLEEPRLAWCKQVKWKKHQNTVYWVDICRLVQKKGFKFYQLRSNGIIFCDTFPAYCNPKPTVMETGEIKNEKVYASPRLRQKISLKHDLMKELGSEVAGGSEDSQQTQPKINNPIGRTERPVSGQSIGLFTQREEIDIDVRLFGLRHAVVKQAENFCVRELVKKIESHLHREALEADLSQKNAYNQFSDDSKAMIRHWAM